MCEMIEHWEARGEAKGKAEALISIINILRRQGKSDEEIRAELLSDGSCFLEEEINALL